MIRTRYAIYLHTYTHNDGEETQLVSVQSEYPDEKEVEDILKKANPSGEPNKFALFIIKDYVLA